MNVKHTIAITLAAVALGFPWLGTGFAASHQGPEHPHLQYPGEGPRPRSAGRAA